MLKPFVDKGFKPVRHFCMFKKDFCYPSGKSFLGAFLHLIFKWGKVFAGQLRKMTRWDI
jgi:hypothetical protein